MTRVTISQALSDLEYLFLENGLKMDAAYIAGLAKENKQIDIHRYMQSTRYLERLDAWKRGRR